jgi:hypothetical protein
VSGATPPLCIHTAGRLATPATGRRDLPPASGEPGKRPAGRVVYHIEATTGGNP